MAGDASAKAAAFRQIRQFGDPVLKEHSRDAAVDEELRDLVERMKKIMHAADGVGLAAPQIGILRKIIVFQLDNQEYVLLNPEITWRSEETITEPEGCLSLASLATEVERAEKVRVEGDGLDGNRVVLDLEGLNARILQHEIDHLNGLMIIDRTSREARQNLLTRLSKTSLPGEE